MAIAAETTGVEQDQLNRLRSSRALATGMLGLSGGVFLATLMVHEPGTPVLLLRAIAEAALVGGLADWFAVTALFRHPLGLPIPRSCRPTRTGSARGWRVSSTGIF